MDPGDLLYLLSPRGWVGSPGNAVIFSDTLLGPLEQKREPLAGILLDRSRARGSGWIAILLALQPVVERMPVVFTVHPRTAAVLDGLQIDQGFRRCPPFSYLPFLGLVANSFMVLADSGGIQEEATVLGIPGVTPPA
jgi:UDP-N-acetylglucosamine 2-epimerase